MTFSYTLDRKNRHITVNEGSTEIPARAFHYSHKFDTIDIADTVLHIRKDAFRESSINEVDLPPSVLTIEEYAFFGSELEIISFGESVQSIGNSAFAHADFNKVVVPDSVESIGAYAFTKNFSLSEATLGDSIQSIGDFAFSWSGLREIVIPDSVVTIGQGAFIGNWTLRSVDLGNSVTSIGDSAFKKTALTEVVIPDSVTSIGDAAFRGTDIATVELPDHFEDNIPYAAFPGGTKFTFGDSTPTPEPEPEPTPEPEPEPQPEPTPEPEPEPEPEPDPDGTTGELTEEGWSSSENSGTWSEGRDAATKVTEIDGFSLFVRDGVTVDTFDGSDKIIVFNENGNGLEVKGTLKMGDGHDLIDVSTYNSLVGIENYGKIDMGDGDDVIVTSVEKVPGDEDALINHKSINMGDGDDLIDARNGGLGGDGKIKMGKGNDEFAGFGYMKLVDGGKGEDRLRLDAGVYSVTKKGSKFRVSKGKGSVDFKSFEEVGSMWSRDDEFVDFDFNKNQFAMVVDQHGASFI